MLKRRGDAKKDLFCNVNNLPLENKSMKSKVGEESILSISSSSN